MLRNNTFLVFITIIAVGGLLPSPAPAKSKCGKKKTECKDKSGTVTDCCSSSQTCKNGRCYYPGELMIIEENKKKAAGKAAPKNEAPTGETTEDSSKRIAMLGEMLQESPDFKVRVQAAFSLSKIKNPKILTYLIKALKDKHPAVRSAAATSLGKAGDPAALQVLFNLLDKDPNPMVNNAAKEAILMIDADPKKLDKFNKVPEIICQVPYNKVKYLFVIGSMSDKAGSKRKDLPSLFKKHLSDSLKNVGKSMIVTSDNVPEAILKKVEDGKIYAFIFSSTLKNLNGDWDGGSGYVTTAQVSIICSKYPTQVLAMTMQSTASSSITKSGYRKKLIPRLQEDAIKGAITSMAGSIQDNLKKITGDDDGKKKKKKTKK
ncbi:MAG: HEAT repeat domain-containing protein [Pseudomonadota bacterium]